jgi:hypothetical protein
MLDSHLICRKRLVPKAIELRAQTRETLGIDPVDALLARCDIHNQASRLQYFQKL